ncbi:hypothetical protein E2320_022497 [Naja naja]|nr:hypothetical protein E2320_022497 [Naja naja]
MRRSWLSLQLLLSCVLLLAIVAVEGRHSKEEESSSEEECHCEKRHHCVEECCKRCCHEEEECCCEKRHHHKDEECCTRKHSHGKEESGKKRHPHVEEEEADENKGSHIGKRHPKKRHLLLKESEEAILDSSEVYEHIEKEERNRIMELAAQDSEAEAIGIMVYVKMILAKTNCTRTKEQEEAGVEYSRAYLEKEGCQLPPKFQQEKHNCTFGIFINMRTEKKAVISQECSIIPGIKLPIF